MRHPNSVRSLRACVVLLAMLAAPAFADGADLLAKALAPMQTFAANFLQETRDASGAVVEASEGTLSLERPARFRIELGSEAGAIVSDGITWWVYESDLLQVVVRDLATYADQIPVLVLTSRPERLYEQYQIDWFVGERGERTFVLSPKAADALFASITIALMDGEPAALEVRSQVGETTRIVFSEASLNGVLAKSTFELVIPDGVDVIDERAAAAAEPGVVGQAQAPVGP